MDIRQRIKATAEKLREKAGGILPFRRDQEEAPVNSVMEYKERLAKKKQRMLIRLGIGTAVIAALVVTGVLTARNWRYGSYRVVSSSDRDDTMSTQYTNFGDYVLKYSSDDVALLRADGEVMWDDPQEMQNPVADICQDSCVVYDKGGRTMAVYNSQGKQGTIETSLPILKARTASQGVVAAILEDGETTWINFYESDGSEIATGKTRIDSPGYPVDLDVSQDGLLLIVSYLTVSDNQPASYVAFYNFGNTGQNQMDNMVSGYTYTDVITPRVSYFDTSRAVAFRDDGFVLYEGKQIPEEDRTVETEEEIVSSFFNEQYIGLVFRNTDGEDAYRMDVYTSGGSLKFSQTFDFAFDKIQISGDQILMYNSNEFSVYTMYGVCRYEGSLTEGNIQNIFKVGGNRYMVIMENGIQTIKLA